MGLCKTISQDKHKKKQRKITFYKLKQVEKYLNKASHLDALSLVAFLPISKKLCRCV